MSLNVKDARTVELVRELSAITGENLTTAIRIAVEERLAWKRASRKADLVQWLDEVTRETAAIMDDGRSSKELLEELYDSKTGLPK